MVRVRGAREHNLKNVDVDIPRDALVVFTGVSGSGKSSLAFSTLYAEAQRRYFESVAPYARRLIDQVGVPDVDSIEGLPPAVALQQQRGTPSTRSSVGSVTTLSSLIRMLYSRAGSYPADQPMLYAEDFSPNTPQGACPECHGLGRVYEVTEALMVQWPATDVQCVGVKGSAQAAHRFTDLFFVQVDPRGRRRLRLLPLGLFEARPGAVGDLAKMLAVIVKAIEDQAGDVGGWPLLRHGETSAGIREP
jgi:excinuclease UvrABC ATPase subunit